MVVAARAADGQPQPHCSDRAGAVHDLLHTVFLHVRATLPIAERIPVEPGSYFLIDSGVGQQISGELLDRELIVRHIAIERVDDPVSIAPRIGPELIGLVTIAIRIAGQIQPVPRPFFTIMRRGKQPVCEPFVCIRTVVRQELSKFLGTRGNSHEI